MSASTHASTADASGRERTIQEPRDSREELLREVRDLETRRRQSRRGAPLWYFLSVAAHLAVFGLVVWFTPLREVVKDAVRKAPTRPVQSVQSVQRMSRLIERAQERTVRSDALAVRDVREQLEAIREEFASNYVAYASASAKEAVPNLERMLSEASRQSESVSRQMRERLRPAAELARQKALENPEQANPVVEDFAAKQMEAMKVQNEVTKALEQALNLAQLSVMPETAKRIESASRKQHEAFEAQQAVKGELERARHEALVAHVRQKQLRDTHLWKSNLTNQMAQANRELAQIEQRKADHRTEVAAHQGKKQAAEAIVERLKREAPKLSSADDLAANRREREQAERTIRDAERFMAAKARDVEQLDKRREQHEKRVARLREDVRKVNLREASQVAEIRLGQEAAGRAKNRLTVLQEQALRRQQEVARLLSDAMKEGRREVPKPELLAQRVVAESREGARSLGRMDVAELYRSARSEEARIVETYRDVRALERAMLANMSLEMARKMTDAATPNRREIDTSVLREDVRTAAQLEAFKARLGEVVRETSSIRASVESLLSTAAASRRAHSEGFSVGFINERAAQLRRESAAAAEDEGQVAKDLTGDSSGARPESQGTFPGLPAVTRAQEMPGQVFGRTISPRGVKGQWMAITSWYVIGPFPNPQRVNIDRKFPPETVLDLDATYVGKDGRLIRWAYLQAPRARIMPKNAEPYGIWYAYTEVRCEQACDLWVAVGSDDKSKIWLNDQVIWESVPWHKEWRINEGYRKVHFKAGRNRILYRIENGQNTMGWSMILATSAIKE